VLCGLGGNLCHILCFPLLISPPYLRHILVYFQSISYLVYIPSLSMSTLCCPLLISPPFFFPSQAGSNEDNASECVLCGLGGNLMCCDGCPASYHSRCLTATHTTRNQYSQEWMCPECRVGGRGECAPHTGCCEVWCVHVCARFSLCGVPFVHGECVAGSGRF